MAAKQHARINSPPVSLSIICTNLSSPHTCHMCRQSHPPALDHHNDIWPGVQTLLITRFSQRRVPLAYSKQLLSTPSSNTLSTPPRFTPISKIRKHYSMAWCTDAPHYSIFPASGSSRLLQTTSQHPILEHPQHTTTFHTHIKHQETL